MKLNKHNWKKVKLGDIAIRTEVTERNPLDNGLDKSIKVEHMDAESLEVKRWGNIGKDLFPPTFYKKFVKGQILFPTRNPHLRRAVIAPFDGICGEKTLTLSANEEMIHKDFFPFIFNSDSFVNHCIKSIVGSTNPHVRWRNVSEYEFLLPNKEEQHHLLGLVIQSKNQTNLNQKLLTSIKQFFQATLDELIPKPSDFTYINSLIKVIKGITYTSNDYCSNNDGELLINLKCFEKYGGFRTDGVKFYKGQYESKHLLNEGDLIIAATDITRNGDVVGYPVFVPKFNRLTLFTMDVLKLEIVDKKKIDGLYLNYLLRTQWAHWHMFAHSSGTTVLHLDSSAIPKLKFPLISLDEQKNISQKLLNIESKLPLIEKQIADLKRIRTNIINEIFI